MHQAQRDAYCELACANSGTVKNDSAVDIDGAIYPVASYARLASAPGDAHFLFDGNALRLGKDEAFQSRRVQVPARGLALFINAFNFASWGLWEQAAPASLSGVPVVVKPATARVFVCGSVKKRLDRSARASAHARDPVAGPCPAAGPIGGVRGRGCRP